MDRASVAADGDSYTAQQWNTVLTTMPIIWVIVQSVCSSCLQFVDVSLTWKLKYVTDLVPTELDVKANIAVELQDSMESLCTGGSYPNFLAKLWPVLKRILEEDPVFVMSWKQVRFLFRRTVVLNSINIFECVETPELRP